jgi:glutathione synthase/RimK-type ligase-like ATP-grasp enzyme
MKVQLLSTKNGMKSGSLKRLAVALTKVLGYKVFRTTDVRPDRKQFRYGDLVNKLEQYKWFQKHGLSALEYTTDSVQAAKWGKEGHVVFGRKLLNASCGDGIVIIEPKTLYEGAQMCPVYTKYKPKKREFRVHVFKDKVVTIVEKRRKTDWNGDKKDTKIRNLANGYVFCQNVELTEKLRERINQLSLAASKVCSSDFRGVDVAYNEKLDDVFVIEVNSAPGIEGSNVDKYVETIKEYV